MKDRPALRVVEEGERSGALTPQKIILDASSGNTGIAYAWIVAVKGYRVQLAVPGNVSQERIGVEELAEEYAGQLKVMKLDVDGNPHTPVTYGVQSIPTLLLFKDGGLVEQIKGAVPEPRIVETVKRVVLLAS